MQDTLARKLRMLRAERGLTLREASQRTGVDKSTLSKIERGITHPHDITRSRLARGYGVPVEELLEEPARAGKAEAPKMGQQSSDESLMSRPEVWKWLFEQGHETWEEFLSLAEELESLEEVEQAIRELHERRDGFIDKLGDRFVQVALFGPPRLEGLSGDARMREVFRPNTLAWKLGWEIRSEYLARVTALANYGRKLFVEGRADDYLVWEPVGERDRERHERMLEERRRVLEEEYAAQLAV